MRPFLGAVLVRVAFWLERASRLIPTVGLMQPSAKFDFVPARARLCLEQPIYAARRVSGGHEFIAQDGYFRRVQALLEQTNRD